MLFSVLALLVVLAVVMKLSASQMQAIGPASSGGQAGAGAPAPADAARRAADLVNKAMEQGAAMRAADAASQ
jgi:hypothetical protein